MKSVLQRIREHVSGIAHVRNAFAQVRGGRFDEWPERTVDPNTVHAMCFPPPRYRAENRRPGVRHFMTGVLIGAAVLGVVFVLV